MIKHFRLVFILLLFLACSKKEITVYELTSEVSPIEGGTIIPAQGTFDDGEQVTISAISSKGYYFKNWSGNISGTNNPYTFTINSDTKVIANFEKDDTYEEGSSITFATIGDFGNGSSDEGNVANLIANLDPDIIITAGDNRYGSLSMDQAIGQFYCDYLDNAGFGPNCSGGNSTTNRFFPTAGNHEYTDGGSINEYLNYFDLPGNNIPSSNTSDSELYYDFVMGPVHFFTIDSYTTLNSPTEQAIQKNWLQSQLAVSTSPWKIVFFHHAPYSSSSKHGSNPNMQWPFAAWGADAVITGHDHTFERLERDGIPYFVNGLGGKSIYSFGTPVIGSQVRYNGDFGLMFGEATSTALIFRFINVQGELIDTYAVQ